MYLQATASYTDGHGTGKMATSEAVMVSADVVAGYDTNGTPGYPDIRAVRRDR